MATKVPKYNVVEKKTLAIDCSTYNDTQRSLIAQDLNDKGHLVCICEQDIQEGTGAYNGAYYQHFEYNSELTTYLSGENMLYAVILSKKQLEQVKNRPNVLGCTGDYDIIGHEDKLIIGCQEIPKDDAVILARKILKHFKAKA
jgi:hypothetical protein